MYSTTAYLYQQKHQVIMIDTSGEYFDRRYAPVYSKKLSINKAVDNVILFQFVNQDQKPVNVTGSSFVFRVISQDGLETLYTKDMDILNAQYGRAKVVIPREDFLTIEAQPAGWSIERNSGVLMEPIFVDDYASARGMVDIVDSVRPEYQDSGIMTIPTHIQPSPSNPNRIHTSEVYRQGHTLTTFQMDFDNFTGNIIPQGSDSYLGPWYNISDQRTYTSRYERDHFNVQGNHGWIRFEINQWGTSASANITVGQTGGQVTNINLTGGGNGWYGVETPRVTVVGVGTGATANATAANAVVNSVTLDSGGEGYVPSLQPQVIIDDGAITRIVYR